MPEGGAEWLMAVILVCGGHMEEEGGGNAWEEEGQGQIRLNGGLGLQHR